MPPTPVLSFISLDEFVNKPVVENYKAMSSEKETKVVRKNDDAPCIEERVSDDEEEDGNPQMDLQDQGVIDSGCSRHMTWNMSYLTDYEEIDGGYVTFGGNPKGGKITGKCTIKTGTKDETSGILKSFITGIDNLVDHKGVLRQFSVARTPQQNGVAEKRNKTLIETAKTMLADSKLPTTFWAEAVNTACYMQNRVLVVKPHNKTSYELFHGRTPTLSFMRPFGCLVNIFNTIDHLGKVDGKADESFFVKYSLNSKAFRVFKSRIMIVEENLHIMFSESTPNDVGSGPDWLFDIDALTRIMNYEPIVASTQSNGFAGTKASDNAGQARKETEPKEDNVNNTNNVNAAGTNEVNVVGGKTSIKLPFDPNMPALEDYSIFDFSRDDEDDGAVADMNNLDTTIQVNHNPTTRIHKDHPLDQVVRDFQSATLTRKMSNNLEEHGFVSSIQQRTNHGKDNGENIIKSIKEGPFQQGPVRARVLNDLSAEEKEMYKADIRATNILL
ncbi:ribonuclease H-like domain-containing protein [Tanacetum coccineum]|uniref:Ribonuclease H-like domain-containing protein n=1 Tax=Tanacetum coccineum TaxID=301880 RepID=A0ABQ5CTT5_9ASTR